MNRQNCAGVVAALGFSLLLLSFFWAGWRDGSGEWTETDADRYQRVSADLHRKSFSARTPEAQAELAELQAEFDGLKGRLVTASRRGAAEAFWLALGGGTLLAAAIGLAAAPVRAAKARR